MPYSQHDPNEFVIKTNLSTEPAAYAYTYSGNNWKTADQEYFEITNPFAAHDKKYLQERVDEGLKILVEEVGLSKEELLKLDSEVAARLILYANDNKTKLKKSNDRLIVERAKLKQSSNVQWIDKQTYNAFVACSKEPEPWVLKVDLKGSRCYGFRRRLDNMQFCITEEDLNY